MTEAQSTDPVMQVPSLNGDARLPIVMAAAPDADLSAEGYRFYCAFPRAFSLWVRGLSRSATEVTPADELRVLAQNAPMSAGTRTKLRAIADRLDGYASPSSAPDVPARTCVCGEPNALGVQHRTDGPCISIPRT